MERIGHMEHKQLAIALFNETWDLIDKAKRSKDEDALMIHASHASLYHWLQIGDYIYMIRRRL